MFYFTLGKTKKIIKTLFIEQKTLITPLFGRVHFKTNYNYRLSNHCFINELILVTYALISNAVENDQIRNACDLFDTHYVQVENVTNLKFRPIVAGPACQTQRLSNLIDILLCPLTKQVKSYLRDTTDFLYHLPSAVPENTLLASLYSNITHTLGIKAIK